MTWDEFKALVEQKLKEAGKDGSIEIDYMDFNGWNLKAGQADVHVGSDLTVV